MGTVEVGEAVGRSVSLSPMEEEGILMVTKETFTQAIYRNGAIPGYRARLCVGM